MTRNILAYLFIALIGSSLGVFTWALATAPSRLPNYLGIRGLKRVRALQADGLWTQLEPLCRWLAQRIQPLISKNNHARLDQVLVGSGDVWGLIPEEVVALCIIGSITGLIPGIAWGVLLNNGPIFVVLGGLLGFGFPYVVINSIVADRRLAITTNLPWAIDLLALGLSAGLDFTGSLRQLVDKSSNPDDPLVEELNLILQELSIGKTRKQALLQFAERNPGPLVKEFVGAVVQAEERGNPLGEVLRIQAETSRSRRSFRAEELAAKASVKLVMPMTLLLVAVLIMIVAPLALDISTTLGDS